MSICGMIAVGAPRFVVPVRRQDDRSTPEHRVTASPLHAYPPDGAPSAFPRSWTDGTPILSALRLGIRRPTRNRNATVSCSRPYGASLTILLVQHTSYLGNSAQSAQALPWTAVRSSHAVEECHSLFRVSVSCVNAQNVGMVHPPFCRSSLTVLMSTAAPGSS